MKTYQDFLCANPYPHIITKQDYEAIQLDAMKEGMRRASRIALKSCFNGGYQFADTLILSAAEQLTEKDLT